MRYQSMSDLMGNISPDVLVEGEPKRPMPEAARELVKASSKDFLEARFLSIWLSLGGIVLVPQHRFHAKRKWRFDFANLDRKIAFEIQGGLYAAQSGHRSFEGVQRDYEKFNAAQMAGWTLFQVTTSMMADAEYMQSLVDYCQRANSVVE